jgi:nucleoside 2-deoxyribosyltransferase
MRIVYVAGPYRGATAWDIERNVRRAEELGFEVSKLGAMPLIPHANTRFFHGLGEEEFWVEGTLELLRRSDAVILTDDWLRSTGARGEVTEARALGRPVFKTIPELGEWIERMRGIERDDRR